jgi:hypothetical protein
MEFMGVLYGFAAGSIATARTISLRPREEFCIDCITPVLVNPRWANGQLVSGPFMATKTGNWQLSANMMGQTELRTDSETSTNYLYNFCPPKPNGQFVCAVWIG